MPEASTLRARLRRLGAAALGRAQTPPLAIHVEGETVNDFDVADRYPGALSHSVACRRWSEERDETATLHLLPLSQAIVTRYYLTVDPDRRLLFQNHGYDGLRVAPQPIDWPIKGDRFDLRAENVQRIEGPAVLIGGPIEGNYSHALFNWFMRFVTLDLLAPEMVRDPAVRFLVDRRAQAEPFLSMLKALGAPLDRIHWIDDAETYLIDQALLVSFTSENAHYPELVHALRDRMRAALLPGALPRPTRRIWIAREHLGPCRRRVSNMDEIRPILARHRVEEVALETLSFADQVRLFAEAELVTGSHGAGFANIIFCQPGARIAVVEKDFNRLLRFDRFFSSLATICDLEPHVIPGRTDQPAGEDFKGFFDRHFADVIVDPAEVEAALSRLA